MSAAGHWSTGTALRLVALALCLVPLVHGCGSSESAPPMAPAGDGLGFDEMIPAPRARFVPIDVRTISARATVELDSLTVNARTAYLKIDTQRIGVTVRLAQDRRTIELTPLEPLRRHQVYTVELSTGITTRDGQSLSRPMVWQFETSVLVRPVLVHPTVGSLPVARRERLEWSGNIGPGTGGVYQVRWSADSATVASGGGDVRYTGTSNIFLPEEELPTETVYWAADALLPGAPALSSTVGRLRSAGSDDLSVVNPSIFPWSVVIEGSTARPRCSQDIVAGPGQYSVLDVGYTSSVMDVRGAEIQLQVQGSAPLPQDLELSIHALAMDWLCSPVGVFTYPTPHVSLGALARSTPLGSRRYSISGGALASHMHWMLRSGRRLQYVLRSNYPVSINTAFTQQPNSIVTVSPRQ